MYHFRQSNVIGADGFFPAARAATVAICRRRGRKPDIDGEARANGFNASRELPSSGITVPATEPAYRKVSSAYTAFTTAPAAPPRNGVALGRHSQTLFRPRPPPPLQPFAPNPIHLSRRVITSGRVARGEGRGDEARIHEQRNPGSARAAKREEWSEGAEGVLSSTEKAFVSLGATRTDEVSYIIVIFLVA
ncbi:Protein of unknown function [Gryllus bimaculatus]|nr:Protein of unknown function [Gryllus bimaculatus]